VIYWWNRSKIQAQQGAEKTEEPDAEYKEGIRSSICFPDNSNQSMIVVAALQAGA
jgi:hypothetical protein